MNTKQLHDDGDEEGLDEIEIVRVEAGDEFNGLQDQPVEVAADDQGDQMGLKRHLRKGDLPDENRGEADDQSAFAQG